MANLIDMTGHRNRMDSVGGQEIAYAIFVNTKGDDVVRVPLAPSARNHRPAENLVPIHVMQQMRIRVRNAGVLRPCISMQTRRGARWHRF